MTTQVGPTERSQPALGSRLRSAFGSRPGRGADNDTVHARARVDRSRVTELYSYGQTISTNPELERTRRPTGRIDLVIPYDGEEYVTRQTLADVAGASPEARARGNALVGHLLLTDHADTDLDTTLGLTDRYGAVPLHLPIDPLGTSSQPPDGRDACHIAYDYAPRPDRQKIHPIDVRVQLLDPDGLDLPSFDRPEDLPAKITQQVTFRPYLLLLMVVRLNLVDERGDRAEPPKVTRVSLGWPTITSLGALSLYVTNGQHPIPVPVQYNPVTRSIEWRDIPMSRNRNQDSGNVTVYESATMSLLIEQPGELYEQTDLRGTVEVLLPGPLLSGLQVRLFDGTGAPADRQPTTVNRLSTDLTLVLGDAFANRKLSPYQHLYFDEVIPDDMRINDIEAALRDRRFRIDHRSGDKSTGWVITATRSQGPDVLQLGLYVSGRQYTTQRQRELPGGQTYRSDIESGELRLYLCGLLPHDSRELTHEMNTLHRAVRERFDRVRSTR
jgi:hypothetical protein